MDIKKDKRFFNIKIITLCLIIAQFVLYFLPINEINQKSYSFLTALLSITKGNIFYSADNLRVSVLMIMSTFAMLSNILNFTGLFFSQNRKRYRGVVLIVFLISSVIFSFCWGAMINISGFVPTLYGFNFLSLILNIIILVLTLKLPDNEIIKKEL